MVRSGAAVSAFRPLSWFREIASIPETANPPGFFTFPCPSRESPALLPCCPCRGTPRTGSPRNHRQKHRPLQFPHREPEVRMSDGTKRLVSPPQGAAPPGVVALYPPFDPTYVRSHEKVARIEIGKRLAVLKGFDFVGEYDPSARYPGAVYFVPGHTLTGVETAALGIRGEHDLFGGVVPHPFVATKAVTHPLVDADAAAPAGWSRDLESRMRGAVLSGFSVFSHADARRAGARLLARGPARLKPVRALGGRGQLVVADADALAAALDAIDAVELAND